LRCFGAEPQAIKFTQHLNPSYCPRCGRVVADVAQRAKRQLRAGPSEIVEFAASGFGQHPDRISAIKGEYLCAGISKPFRRDQAQSRGLAGTRWTKPSVSAWKALSSSASWIK
jgi:hypothetical protein